MNSDQAHDQSQTGTVEGDKAPYERPELVCIGSAQDVTEFNTGTFVDGGTSSAES